MGLGTAQHDPMGLLTLLDPQCRLAANWQPDQPVFVGLACAAMAIGAAAAWHSPAVRVCPPVRLSLPMAQMSPATPGAVVAQRTTRLRMRLSSSGRGA